MLLGTHEELMRTFSVSKGFPGSSVGKESTCNVGGPSSIPGSRRSAGRHRLLTPVFLGFLCGSAGKESAYSVGDLGLIPGLEYPLGKEKATHSSILAWRIPWSTVHGVAKSQT